MCVALLFFLLVATFRLSVFVCLSFPLCAPCYWGMSSCCSNFTCWQLSPGLSLRPLFSPSFILSCLNSLMHFHELSSSFFMAALKGLLPEGNRDEERHAGWFPSATYLQVMGLRKSDPREFIMRITNPPVGCSTSSCGLQGVVEVCLWL